MSAVSPEGSVPKVTIDNPKNDKNKDLSDHYPIIINAAGLKIISYNLQFMPTLIIGIEGKQTTPEIQQAAINFANYFFEKNADVCCVQELFDNTANELLEEEMRKRGYEPTDRLNSDSPLSVSFFNGGARTFVKKRELAPKLTTYEYVYKNKIDYFIGADALVNKGVTHTCIEDDDGTKPKVHIFNTHLQAYYPKRDHYAEIALAQVVEFKKFIELQKAKGIIGPNDKIVMCGDFNIPKPNPGEKPSFLFEKMARMLGPQFTFLDYDLNPSGPQRTVSLENSYNRTFKKNSDNDVSVDMGIIYNPGTVDLSQFDSELSDIYCDIQLAIAHYVRKNATLSSMWLLPQDKILELKKFNEQVQALIDQADEIKLNNKNPIDNQEWLAKALKLSSGPGRQPNKIAESEIELHDFRKSTIKPIEEPIIELQDTTMLPEEDMSLDTVDQCKEKFDKLMHNLKKFHAEVHNNYIESPNQYEKAFETSLKLNHILLNAGDRFFKKPTNSSLKEFQKICDKELHTANKEFEKHSGLWSKLHPFIKDILGVIAALTVIPALIIEGNSPHGFRKTFFSTAPCKVLTDIKKDYDNDNDISPKS